MIDITHVQIVLNAKTKLSVMIDITHVRIVLNANKNYL